jgi:acyl-CoA synthetase (AMP-forming)/AMP-acid ligase II
MIEPSEEVPKFVKLRLERFEEEFHQGLLTELGLEKKRANLLKPYVKPTVKTTKLGVLDVAVVDRLLRASDDDGASDVAKEMLEKDMSDDSLYAAESKASDSKSVEVSKPSPEDYSWQNLHQEAAWTLRDVLNKTLLEDTKTDPRASLPFVAPYQRSMAESEAHTNESSCLSISTEPARRQIAYIETITSKHGSKESANVIRRFPTLIHALKDRAEETPKKLALTVVNGEGKKKRSMTYHELYKHATRLAHFIDGSAKLAKHNKILLFFNEQDIIDCVVHVYGCMLANMHPILLIQTHVDGSPHLLDMLVHDMGINTVFVSKSTQKVLKQHISLPDSTWERVHIHRFNYKGNKKTYEIVTSYDDIAYTLYCPQRMTSVPILSDSMAIRVPMVDKSIFNIKTSRGAKTMERDLITMDHATLTKQCLTIAQACRWRNDSPAIHYGRLDTTSGWLLNVFLPVSLGFPSFLMSRTQFLTEPRSLLKTISRHEGATCMLNAADTSRLIYSLENKANSSFGNGSCDLSSLQNIFLVATPVLPEACHRLSQLLAPIGFQGTCTVLMYSEETGLFMTLHPLSGQSFSTVHLAIVDAQLNRVRCMEESDQPDSNCTESNADQFIHDASTVNGFAPMPNASILLVEPESKVACYMDEIGEFWVQLPETNMADRPVINGCFDQPILPSMHTQVSAESVYARTGIVGFMRQGILYPLGKLDSRMKLYSAPVSNYVYLFVEDIIDSMRSKIIGIDEVMVLRHSFHNEHVMIILAEMAAGQDDQTNMKKTAATLYVTVRHYIKEHYQVDPYSIAIVAPHRLPRDNENRIDAAVCKRDFFGGTMEFLYIRMDPYNALAAISNIAMTTKAKYSGSSATIMAISEHLPVLEFSGEDFHTDFRDEATGKAMTDFRTLPEILVYRSEKTDNSPAFLVLDAGGKLKKSITFSKFATKVVRLASFLTEKKNIQPGSIVTLVYRSGIHLFLAIHACLYAGIIFACAPFPEEDMGLDNLAFILKDNGSTAILGDRQTEKRLRSKQTLAYLNRLTCSDDFRLMTDHSKFIVTEKMSIKFKSGRQTCMDLDSPDRFCMLEYYQNAEGMSPGIMLGHDTLLARCRQQRDGHQLGIKRPLLASVQPYTGLDLIYSAFLGIYLGCPTIICDMSNADDHELHPTVWIRTISTYHISHVMASYALLEGCAKLADHLQRDEKHMLKHVQSMILATGHRSRADVLNSCVERLNHRFGLPNDALELYYGALVNPCISMRGLMVRAPAPIHLCLPDLMEERISVNNEPSQYRISLMDSGQIAPATRIAIIERKTFATTQESAIGEIWVRSEANGKGFYQTDGKLEKMFDATPNNFQKCVYARTGDTGFVMTDSSKIGLTGRTARHFLYLLGKSKDSFQSRGLTHHVFDLERTIESCHHVIPELGSMVIYREPNLNVLVEISDSQLAARVYPLIMTSLLEFHRVIADHVYFLKTKSLERTQNGEKRRSKAERIFLESDAQEIIADFSVRSLGISN